MFSRWSSDDVDLQCLEKPRPSTRGEAWWSITVIGGQNHVWCKIGKRLIKCRWRICWRVELVGRLWKKWRAANRKAHTLKSQNRCGCWIMINTYFPHWECRLQLCTHWFPNTLVGASGCGACLAFIFHFRGATMSGKLVVFSIDFIRWLRSSEAFWNFTRAVNLPARNWLISCWSPKTISEGSRRLEFWISRLIWMETILATPWRWMIDSWMAFGTEIMAQHVQKAPAVHVVNPISGSSRGDGTAKTAAREVNPTIVTMPNWNIGWVDHRFRYETSWIFRQTRPNMVGYIYGWLIPSPYY